MVIFFAIVIVHCTLVIFSVMERQALAPPVSVKNE